MKVVIEADSQTEFDEKRESLIKALAGTRFNIELSPKNEVAPMTPRESPLRAQNEIFSYWDERYASMISEIKREISEVLSG